MDLAAQLSKDMIAAMKAKDKETLSTVRMLKASVQNEAIRLGHDLQPDEAAALMAKEYKQRKEALEEFEQAGRDDLVTKTKHEMAVVEKYLPKQMSPVEVAELVEKTVAEVKATSMRDFGKVMGAIMPKVKGKADGQLVNELVKKTLQNQG